MSKKKFLLFGLILIMILIISFWLVLSEKNNLNQRNNAEKTERENTQSLKKVETVLYNNKKSIKWNMNSEKIANFGSKQVLDLKDLKIDAFSLDQKQETSLYSFTSPSGKYFNNQSRLSLEGPVVINKDNYTLEAGNMVWDQKQNLLQGSQGIRIESRQLILEGEKFNSNLEFNNIKVSGTEEKRAHLYWKENETHESEAK